MKAAAFAIAIMLGGTAFAQTAGTTATGDQTQTGWNATPAQTTMAMNSTGAVVEPSNAAPKRDERGIRVISAPAVVPSGYNGTVSTGTGGPLVDPTTGQAISDKASTRACTRTVTDHCVQTYERTRRR